jgi:hypothetical protein
MLVESGRKTLSPGSRRRRDVRRMEEGKKKLLEDPFNLPERPERTSYSPGILFLSLQTTQLIPL